MVVREMVRTPALGYRPVGFIDDDPAKAGARIHGVQVLGSREELASIIAEKRPAEVLLSVPRADVGTIRACMRLRRRSSGTPQLWARTPTSLCMFLAKLATRSALSVGSRPYCSFGS